MAAWDVDFRGFFVSREICGSGEEVSACNKGSRSLLEQNGLQAAYIMCFSEDGVCFQQSRIFFPSLFAYPGNPRGYLQASFEHRPLAKNLRRVKYDGVQLQLTFKGTEEVLVTLAVSPSHPLIWMTMLHQKPQVPEIAQGTRKRTLICNAGPHRVWKHEEWITRTYVEIAYTCFDHHNFRATADIAARTHLVNAWSNAMAFDCPEPELCVALQFAKIRTCEAIFRTARSGIVHSPGGGMFYSGVWTNDQAEYATPVLAMLGLKGSLPREAAINSVRVLASWFDYDVPQVPYSVEVDGGYIGRLDRGDAAMFAWGASLMILTCADESVTDEFFPHVKFTCKVLLDRIALSDEGIVQSVSDELEGRYPTGSANLSVNCISILALESAAEAALSANEVSLSKQYAASASGLRVNVHRHFRAPGPRKYKYFAECDVGRGWACLAALAQLPDGTQALWYSLNELWGEDGVRVAEGNPDVWDRCSLYAIRAAYRFGSVETATERLLELVRKRLRTGVAAPYMQENNSSHAQLAAESALLLRVVTEGLLGIQVGSGMTIVLTPQCPFSWPGYSVRNLFIGEVCFSFDVRQDSPNDRLTVQTATSETSITTRLVRGERLRIQNDAKRSTLEVQVCTRGSGLLR